jgi:hypothetical protein
MSSMNNYFMKKIILILTTLFLSNLSHADSNNFGLGLILNNPTGFSGKYRLSKSRSIDGALGYSFGSSNVVTLHSTYIWENNQGFKVDQTYIGYYFGIGGALYSRDKTKKVPHWADDNLNDELGLAVRGLGGLNYYFNSPRIEVFAELALNFFFVPATDVDFGIAIGGRYYF